MSESPGYTVLHVPHICPKPDGVPINTLIRCDTCGRRWRRTYFGWIDVTRETNEMGGS